MGGLKLNSPFFSILSAICIAIVKEGQNAIERQDRFLCLGDCGSYGIHSFRPGRHAARLYGSRARSEIGPSGQQGHRRQRQGRRCDGCRPQNDRADGPGLRPVRRAGHHDRTTNIVLLDGAGNAILDERILVSIDEGNTVRVYRQTERSVLSCTPNCEQHSQQGEAASAN